MKRLLYLLAILLIIVLGAYFQYLCCCNNANSCKDNKKQVAVAKKQTKPLANLAAFNVKDGDFSINSNENFNFSPSSFKINGSVSEKIKGTIGQLKNYFVDKPSKYLNIKGYYADFETNNSVFPNLGLARANAVKKYFIDQGFNHSQINILSELTDKITPEMSLLKGMTAYEITTLDAEGQSNRLKSLKEFGDDLKKNPITLYFDTGASYINLSLEERSKVQKINEYLNQVEDSRLLIVGHTDNTGNAEANKALGEKRATFVKNYFVKNGFLAKKIEVDSKGQNSPIDTNDTEEGRAKNRRVEVTIK